MASREAGDDPALDDWSRPPIHACQEDSLEPDVIEGWVRFDEIGERSSGEFEFSMWAVAQDSRNPQGQTLTAYGTFTGVTLAGCNRLSSSSTDCTGPVGPMDAVPNQCSGISCQTACAAEARFCQDPGSDCCVNSTERLCLNVCNGVVDDFDPLNDIYRDFLACLTNHGTEACSVVNQCTLDCG